MLQVVWLSGQFRRRCFWATWQMRRGTTASGAAGAAGTHAQIQTYVSTSTRGKYKRQVILAARSQRTASQQRLPSLPCLNRYMWEVPSKLSINMQHLYALLRMSPCTTPCRRVGEWKHGPTTLHLGNRLRWVASFTSRLLYRRGNSRRYPLYKRLGGARTLFRREQIPCSCWRYKRFSSIVTILTELSQLT